MEDLNRIELCGTVGNVSVVNVGGTSVAHLSLQTNNALKGNGGEIMIDITWHNVTIWKGRNVPDPASIRKGDRLRVTGRVRVSKFTGSDGGERAAYEVIANKAEIVKQS